MALIAIASDKGAPGVTTAALALAAVWPRPVLLAECDPAGGDLVYRFPAAGGGHLDPRRGVLSLAVVARRGMQPQQVWEHVQKLHGGLDVLAGVTNAEQGAGLSLLWGPIGKALAALPQADVIADCGRLGADGPLYDLLVEATTVVLVSKVHVADVIRLRDRTAAFAAAAQARGRRGFGVGVVVVAEHKKFRAALGEVQHVLGQANAPATVLGGIAHDTKGADLLSGEWGGSLDRTMLIKTAREVAQQLVQGLPPIGDPAPAPPAYPAGAHAGQPAPGAHAGQPAAGTHAMVPPPPAPAGRRHAAPQPAAAGFSGSQFSGSQFSGSQFSGPQPPRSSATGPESAATRFAAPQPAFAPNPVPPGPWQADPEPGRPEPGRLDPARPDLAAVTLSAPVAPAPPVSAPAVSASAVSVPTVSADAPRTTFSRVLGGRTGRHQADPAQANGGPDQPQPMAAPGQPGPAQLNPAQLNPAQLGPAQIGPAQDAPTQPRVAARHAAPAGGRPGDGPGFPRAPMPPLTSPAAPGDPENAEDPGWGTAPWQRQGPMSRPGGE